MNSTKSNSFYDISIMQVWTKKTPLINKFFQRTDRGIRSFRPNVTCQWVLNFTHCYINKSY